MQTRCHALSMLGVLSVAVSALAGGQAGTPEHPSPSRGGEEQARVEQAQALRLARQNGWVLRREGRAGTIELQGIFRGIPLYYTTTNLDAADSLSTDECWPGGSSGLGLTGTGVTLGIWDAGGVRTTHQEFTARATQVDSPSGTHWHSTHVAGTMVAAGLWVDDGTYPDGQSKGMSYAASLSCYDWNDDDAEMAAAAAAGLRVSNHSYGFVTGWRYDDFGPGTGWYWFGDVEVSPTEDYYFGFYSFQAANWDAIAYDHPHYLFVTSAGNDRDEGPSAGTGHWFWDPNLGDWAWSTAARNLDGNNGYDSVSHQAVAKNGLTVGAVHDVVGGYAGPGSVNMTSFSCWGPTDDGRIKPDVVGNGQELLSAHSASDSAYAIASGTSMASPNVSGSLGLLIEQYRDTHPAEGDLRSATLKALVIHTADEAGSADGPDYEYGWGLMNTLAAANTISADVAEPLTISEQTSSNGEMFELSVATDAGSSALRATLGWIDPAGTSPSPSLDPTTKMLVNDLDLRIDSVPARTTYYPWVLDPANPSAAAATGDNDTDNAEQVVISSPAAGYYVLRVTHKGTLSGGTQDFSLIITGASSIALFECHDDGDCDDGQWCNGAETCLAGRCQAGTPPDCSDTDPCTDDACDEVADECVHIDTTYIDVAVAVDGLDHTVTRDVRFVITDCDGQATTRVEPVSFNSNGIGSITLTGVGNGADWIQITEGHTLTTRAPLAFNTNGGCGATVELAGTSGLLAGDLQSGSSAQDGFVDILDFVILASRWESCVSDCDGDPDTPDAECSLGADVNGDGYQDGDDFAVIQPNFFETGDAAHGCGFAAAGPSGGETRGPLAAIRVGDLPLADGQRADVNTDGLIDGSDVRAFAQKWKLPLLPAFEQKLARLEAASRPPAAPGLRETR